MKKLTVLVTVAGMFTLIACGPSAAEKAAKEKAKQDSIASYVMAAKVQATADSTAKYNDDMKSKMAADSAAHAKKSVKGKAAKKHHKKKK